MSVEIDCPSGMQLRIRGLKGKEGKLLADRTAARQGTVLDSLLEACTEEVRDPGPYELKSNGKLDWNDVLLGDRLYVLLQIRLASFGPDYGFKTQCREATCRERFDYEIDLGKDLEIKRMSAEDQETLKQRGTFTTTLDDGKEVRYRLATGADERRAAKSRGSDGAMVEMLCLRITAIQGVGEPDPTSLKPVQTIRAYLEDLDWGELVHLMNALNEHDCGVNTQIEIECPVCGAVQEVQLPLERGFLLPTENRSKN